MWNYRVIFNLKVTFEIVDISGFEKLGRTGYYLVQYRPRMLDADDEFPLNFQRLEAGLGH